jgi:subtilisin-like proprotein convertase family protein/C1A family cysteine protease
MNKLFAFRSFRIFSVLPYAVVLATLAACSSSDEQPVKVSDPNNTPASEEPLSNLDDLLKGAPDNSKLPEEGKADAVYPPVFTELVALQSPIRNQGRRGVCSIFSTVALMEHLYIKEGTITNPDFSEQYLQWSTKFEVKDFLNTSGSNARTNLEAINRFGLVEENAWKYEANEWGTANDPACDGGKTQPTQCYTNGQPPDAAKSAKKWYLPAGRWINHSVRSIKANMATKKTAVVWGADFFYQAWNHGGSSLKVSNEYKRKGYVTYPSDADKKDSREPETRRAGHSILLIGWDDNLEVPMRDGEGKPMVDAEGKPMVEKGFFIFKNSWGTTGFGTESPFGAGFGYLSFKYVEEFGSAYTSDIPKVELPKEVCNDGEDNDRDGKVDCDDSDCGSDVACAQPNNTFSSTESKDIPDNNASGVQSDIQVTSTGVISSLAVTVDISHTFRGDLVVKLVKEGGKTVVLSQREGGSDDDLKRTFSVPDFNGADMSGKWSLVVSDLAKDDVGKINSWSLDFTACSGASCGSATTSDYENTMSMSIPDNSATGITSEIVINDPGAIKSLKVNVDITHPYQGDVSIKLQKLLSKEVILLAASAQDGPMAPRSFTVTEFKDEDAKGTWRLIVTDNASSDTGTLNKWSMTVER